MITYPQKESTDKIYAKIWTYFKLDYFGVPNKKITYFVSDLIHWQNYRKDVCKMNEKKCVAAALISSFLSIIQSLRFPVERIHRYWDTYHIKRVKDTSKVKSELVYHFWIYPLVVTSDWIDVWYFSPRPLDVRLFDFRQDSSLPRPPGSRLRSWTDFSGPRYFYDPSIGHGSASETDLSGCRFFYGPFISHDLAPGQICQDIATRISIVKVASLISFVCRLLRVGSRFEHVLKLNVVSLRQNDFCFSSF